MVNLVEGKEYRVTQNLSHHDFPIGEVVRFVERWNDAGGLFEYLDGSDEWAMDATEVEEVV